MSEFLSETKSVGYVEIIVDYLDGEQEVFNFKNTVLSSGKMSLANTLAGDYNSYYLNQMVFGTQGTMSGTPRTVSSSQSGLFGSVLLSIPVITTINQSAPQNVTATSVIPASVGNGNSINEAGLILGSGDYFSVLTFGDLAKTSSQQWTINWTINFL